MEPTLALSQAMAQAITAASRSGMPAAPTWSPFNAGPLPAEFPCAAGDAAVCLSFQGMLTGQLYVCASSDASGQLFPEALGRDAAADGWTALWSGAATELAAFLSSSFGDVKTGAVHSAPLPAERTPVGMLVAAPLSGTGAASGMMDGEEALLSLYLLADAALAAQLEGNVLGGLVPALERSAAVNRAPLNRVLDVPLAVTLRFGQRQLLLRELLELTTGSLLELDQQVDEPVHLMLGERIIARGEVVIVDGNYGLRVFEVVEHPGRVGAAFA